MKDVKECIICGSKEFEHYRAMVAPFLAERIWKKKSLTVQLIRCKKCGVYFFNPRLEDYETEILYKNYRDDQYQQQRYKHEQWYTKEMNELIGKNNIELMNRKNNLYNILSKNIDISSIKSVLDFGGDKGQFIIDELSSANRYVYDVSGIEPNKGITKLTSLSECNKYKYDLIMCCHVLEHVSYPNEILQDIKSLSDKNTIVYIEVPFESPFITGKFKRWGSSLKILIKNPFKLIKTVLSLININMPRAWMHEHVNFFTIDSMRELMQINGFKVITIETQEIDLGWTKSNIISCLAVSQ
jgi:hypothetical protein